MCPLRPLACMALMLLPVSCGLSLNYPAETEALATPPSTAPGGANTRVGEGGGSEAFGVPAEG